MRYFKIYQTFIIFLTTIFTSASLYAFDSSAKQLLLLDYDSGHIMLEKNAHDRMYPASMTKMMTIYILFERIAEGVLSLDDRLPISKKAWRMGGSKMFLEVGKKVKIADLLRGIIVQSGNDASIVAAEGIAGSEKAFAEIMNSKAQELKMMNSNFVNASGWPDDNHYTTAHDLALLVKAIIKDFPELYKIYSEKTFTYSNIKQNNRNPLLYSDVNADGLKTGHTEASGYGLAASAVANNGRRVIMIINGLESKKQRSIESERLMAWAVREWKQYQLFASGESVINADVWLGNKPKVKMITKNDVNLLIPRTKRSKLKVNVNYLSPIAAPINVNEKIGNLSVMIGDEIIQAHPLYAGETINELSFFARMNAGLDYLIFGGQ